MNIPPMFELFKTHLLDAETTELLRRKIRMKIKVYEASHHGKERPFHIKKSLEELTRLNSEFSAYALERGWDSE